MKNNNYYSIEVIEPNKNLKISPFWKQKCNFFIEVIKINICDEHKKRKKEKNKSLLHNGF